MVSCREACPVRTVPNCASSNPVAAYSVKVSVTSVWPPTNRCRTYQRWSVRKQIVSTVVGFLFFFSLFFF